MSDQQWTPASFEIALGTLGDHGIALCESHRETVEGETWGPFGLNRDGYLWVVTHLPTGYQLVEAISREAARRFCHEINDLADWANVRRCPPEIRDEVLMAWHRARGAMFIDCSEPQAVAVGAP